MHIRPENLRNFLDVIQVCDSTFPIGTFNHSYGMENYLRTDRITNSDEFELWLGTYLKSQFKYGEGLVISLTMKALKENEIEKIWVYDQLINCSSQAIETRNGSKMIAKQMTSLIQVLHDIPALKEYQTKIKGCELYGNPAITFALFAFEKEMDINEAILLYGYSVNSTMIQNAVRAIPLGQKDGQLILKRSFLLLELLLEEIDLLDKDYIGANIPGLELAQIKHEEQTFRLFMS